MTADPRFLDESQRLHNAAAAVTTARGHFVRTMAQVDGLDPKLHRDANFIVSVIDDYLVELADAHATAAKRERLASAEGILERLDDSMSDYEGVNA